MLKRKKVLYLILIVEFVIVLFFKRDIANHKQVLKIERLPEQANVLRSLGGERGEEEIVIYTYSPVEFDFLSREEVYRIRKSYVKKNKDLVEGDYEPIKYSFGSIVGGKPWWGLRGQMCYGNGKRSIEGLSEESRFFANPFHLLYLIEGRSYKGGSCFPTYPQPYKLSWQLNGRKAVAKYDITKFFKAKDFVGSFHYDESLMFANINAIDFGYNYIYIDPKMSKGIKPTRNSRVLKEICRLKNFIHLGRSCGYPGGCNNGSPSQPELHFEVKDVPTTIYCKLWKKRPNDKKDDADFVFIVELE